MTYKQKRYIDKKNIYTEKNIIEKYIWKRYTKKEIYIKGKNQQTLKKIQIARYKY